MKVCPLIQYSCKYAFLARILYKDVYYLDGCYKMESSKSSAEFTHLLIALLAGVCIGFSSFLIWQHFSIIAESYPKQFLKCPPPVKIHYNMQQSPSDPNGKSPKNHQAVMKQHPKTSDLMYNKVRILCWILTSPSNFQTKAKAVKETWGKRCNKILFMSSEEDVNLPAIKLKNVKEGRDELWGKSREAFRYIWENYEDEFDWFYKADDDTYAIMENMRYFLSAYNTSDPMWFGYKFDKYVRQGFFSGGAGYILSKEALKRFAKIGYQNPKICRHDHHGDEDVEMGKCMENLNVKAMDTRDSQGRGRFFPISTANSISPSKVMEKSSWFWKMMYYRNIEEGLPGCCSDSAIAFHYIDVTQMYAHDYLIYQLRPYGANEVEARPSIPEPPPDMELTTTPWVIKRK